MSNPSPTLHLKTAAPNAAEPAVPAHAQAAEAGLLQRLPWLREPLLHFLLLGAVLFAVDHWLAGREDDPSVIVISPTVQEEARQLFKASRGRDPNAAEWAALRSTWLDNEVLYREGLAMQVDRGDTAIRERVIFKALSVVDANVQRPPVTDEALRAWFEKNRAKYDEPVRLDFQEAVVAGDSGEPAVRAMVDQLNKGGGGELGAGLRVFKGRPLHTVVQSYGAEFAAALQTATPGEWRTLNTREGWRAVRLEGLSAAKPAHFATLRNVVLQDWTDVVMSEQRTQAVRALARKYTIRDDTQQP